MITTNRALVVVVVLAVGREAWWWLAGAGRLLRRYPIRTLLIVAALGVSVWQHAWVWTAVIVVPVLLTAMWARIWPVSYTRRLADPVRRHRRSRWVRKHWRSVTESCGLGRRTPRTVLALVKMPAVAVAPAERVQTPDLKRIRWSSGQLIIWPGLLPGQTVADVEEAGERLRTTLGAHWLRVLADDGRYSCRIVCRFGDPLAQPFDTPTPDPGTILLDRVPLGRTEDDTVWSIDLRMSTLTVGSAGAGKGSVMWSLLLGLAPAIRAGLVQVHGIDLKGGMELGLGRPLFTRYADHPAQAVQLLEDAVTDCETRARAMAGHSRLHQPSTAAPLVLVLVDELASLVSYLPDRDLLRRAEAALARLCSIGRAPGFFVYGFLQDPRKETLQARHLFQQTIALRVRDREEVAMVLGDGAVNAGAAAHQIPRSTPGIGYAQDETGHLVRVRAGYVPDQLIRHTAAHFFSPVQTSVEPSATPDTAAPTHTSRSPRTSGTARPSRSPRSPRSSRSGSEAA